MNTIPPPSTLSLRGGNWRTVSYTHIHNFKVWKNIRDQVVPVLILLQSTECHLRARNVLLWILKVFELLLPSAILPLLFLRVGTVGIPGCPPAIQCPLPCWHRCMRSL